MQTVVSFIITLLFILFFNFTKHNPVLRQINVFNQDPYDATSSFGIFLAVFATIASFLKPKLGKIAVFGILISLIVDIVALVRFQLDWVGKNGAMELVGLTFGMLILTLIAFKMLGFWRTRWQNASVVSLILLFVLFIFPQHAIDTMMGEVLAASTGILVLFTAIWAWYNFPKPQTRFLPLIIFLGLMFGLSIFPAETFGEHDSVTLQRLITVGSIFIGVGGFGLATGYVLLSRLFE